MGAKKRRGGEVGRPGSSVWITLGCPSPKPTDDDGITIKMPGIYIDLSPSPQKREDIRALVDMVEAEFRTQRWRGR